MVDGIGDRCRDPDNADFADALGAQPADDAVVLFDEDHLDVVDVGVDRYVVLGVVVVHEATERVIGMGLLVQRLAYSPDDAAGDLATRCLRVDYAPGCNRADHPGDANGAEILVDPHLAEDR